MKFNLFAGLLLMAFSFSAAAHNHKNESKSELKSPSIGAAAPDFTAQGHDGKTYKLSDFKGKTVVLEWFNDGCPYVEKHYGSNNMQTLQKTYTDKGVVWLTVASSKKGAQGHLDKAKASEIIKNRKSAQTAILLDDGGKLGRTYGAKTTPHMFVINPKGVLVYQGAIDNNSSSRKSTIEGAENYVAAALDATLANKAVEKTTTEPYGCSVKY
jgi:peroxiredoxin